MHFPRRTDIVNGRPYKTYREETRGDFRKFCAYCFQHEDEAGGPGHFELDHFQPNCVENAARKNDFFNLYWSCRCCNSRYCKGTKWPSEAQLALGERFVDCCTYDPEGVDYVQNAEYSLQAITPAGKYTIDAIRLNEREELLRLRRDRDRIRKQYISIAQTIEQHVTKAKLDARFKTDHAFQAAIRALEISLDGVRAFVQANPFVLSRFPDPVELPELRDLCDRQ